MADIGNSNKVNHPANNGQFSRREILKYSAGTFAVVSFGSLTAGCGGGSGGGAQLQPYPIDSTNVGTTQRRMLAFPSTPSGALSSPLLPQQLSQVANYSKLGYGNWTFGSGLPVKPRHEIMPISYRNAAPVRNAKFANFFAFTDIHITDKEAPNQLIYMQQFDPGSYTNTSI